MRVCLASIVPADQFAHGSLFPRISVRVDATGKLCQIGLIRTIGMVDDDKADGLTWPLTH